MSSVNESSGKSCWYWLCCCWCCGKEEETPSPQDPLLGRDQHQSSVNPVRQMRSTTPPPTPPQSDSNPGTPDSAYGKQTYQGVVTDVSPEKVRTDQYV